SSWSFGKGGFQILYGRREARVRFRDLLPVAEIAECVEQVGAADQLADRGADRALFLGRQRAFLGVERERHVLCLERGHVHVRERAALDEHFDLIVARPELRQHFGHGLRNRHRRERGVDRRRRDFEDRRVAGRPFGRWRRRRRRQRRRRYG